MAEQLARAAASGLLDAAPGRPMTDADPRQAPSPDPDPDRGAGADVPEAHSPALPLRAGTAFDAALRAASVPVQTRAAPICPEAPPPIAAWSASGRFDQGLGPLRLALFDAARPVAEGCVILLARHYLYYGFGPKPPSGLGRSTRRRPSLRVIAGLVDGMPGPHFPPEPDPLICSDEDLPVALSRRCAGDVAPDRDGGRSPAAGDRGLAPGAARPDRPRVARRLQADGFGHAARNLRDLLWRAGNAAAQRAAPARPGTRPGARRPRGHCARHWAWRCATTGPTRSVPWRRPWRSSAALARTIPAGRVVAAEALLRETRHRPRHRAALARDRAGPRPRRRDRADARPPLRAEV